MLRGTPEGDPVGLIEPDLLAAEYAAYLEAGVWPEGEAPEDTKPYDADIAVGMYDDAGVVIWPG